MTIKIERAVPEDAEALTAVQIAAFHDDTRLYGVELGGPPGYDDVEFTRKAIHEDDMYKILVDGVIVGGAGVFIQDEGHCHLNVLFVHPDQHGKGIGSRVMEFLEATYPSKRWTLHTPLYATRNQHFYEKFGYMKVGEEIEPGGIVLIAYEKQASLQDKSKR